MCIYVSFFFLLFRPHHPSAALFIFQAARFVRAVESFEHLNDFLEYSSIHSLTLFLGMLLTCLVSIHSSSLLLFFPFSLRIYIFIAVVVSFRGNKINPPSSLAHCIPLSLIIAWICLPSFSFSSSYPSSSMLVFSVLVRLYY